MLNKVTKEMWFEAAHLLSDHNGLCRNLHGHSYRVQVTVAGKLRPHENMVMDFADLKEKMTKVIGELDHAFLCQRNGGELEDQIAALLRVYNARIVILPYAPTAENLCSYIYHYLEELGVTPYEVKVWETASSFASYGGAK